MATLRSIALATAAACAAVPCPAQPPQPDGSGSSGVAPTTPATQTVVVTGRSQPAASVSGFDDVPLSRAPFAAATLDIGTLGNAGVAQLAQAARLDASLSDAYNSQGYWSNFTIRGFVLDPRTNFRRDGLPINNETALWLGNKQAIEALRGTSGLQAGVSAPGGLINLLIKRPQGRLREASFGWQSQSTLGVALDLGDRAGAGEQQAFGWRLSASHERLDPLLRSAEGTRDGVALAAEGRLGGGSVLEAEVEFNRQSQPSQPGFSILGSRVPDAHTIDPRLNLNNQPWSPPVVFAGQTGSLRWTQPLAGDLQLKLHAMAQRLRSDDRIAFPFGCSAEGTFDRYCSDGSFDYYDFRSDGERRRNEALDAALSGSAALAGTHRWSVGLLGTRSVTRFQPQAFNFVGVGTIDGNTVVPPDPSLTTTSADRDERSVELYARDRWMLSPQWSLWLGLRHTRLDRELDQSFTTPWLAASYRISEPVTAYASWGHGIESAVVPNLPTYDRPGQALPALRSRQLEAGLKGSHGELDWSLAAFDIDRPVTSDVDCATLCRRVIDGRQRHRGIEASAQWRAGAWSLLGSAAALRARREGATSDPALNGLKPVNVPERSLRAQAGYHLGAPAGLPGASSSSLSAALVHEGPREVLPDNSLAIGGWTRLDLAARVEQKLGDGTRLTWLFGVDNVADRRAWQEAPYQFAHVYLFPMAPRTWRASVQAAF